MSGKDFEFGVTPFYFVRHGETPESERGIVQGQSETELSATGRKTAESAAKVLSSIPIGSIYASPLKRAWRTASIISVLVRAPVYSLPGLMERHWGIYERRPKKWRPPLRNPGSAETMEDFTNRVLDAMESIRGPSPVLVVAHSGVFRVIAEHAGLPMHSHVSVASSQPLNLEPTTNREKAWRISLVTAP